MDTVRIALCFDPALLLTDSFADPSADVLVMPELADTGYRQIYNGVAPHTKDDSYFNALRVESTKTVDSIVAGTMFFADKKRNTNSCFVFHKGGVRHRYDKIHLFQPCRDDEFFESGVKNESFSISLRNVTLKAGVIICYDLRFPELVRTLAARGIQILFVPARWPKIRDDAWGSLLKARAIENQIFVVGCNANDDEGGYSYVYSPTGSLVYSNADNVSEMWATFDLELDQLTHARAGHNNMADAVFLRSLLEPKRIKAKQSKSAPSKKRRRR